MSEGGPNVRDPAGPPSNAPAPAAAESARLVRRLGRERQARLDAEGVAERVTRELYDAVQELTDAEARARIVSDTAAEIFGGALKEAATLGAIADSAARALKAARATCFVFSEDGGSVGAVHTTETDPLLVGFLMGAQGHSPGVLPVWEALARARDPLLVLEDLARSEPPQSALPGPASAGALLGLRLEHESVKRAGRRVTLGALVLEFDGRREFSAGERTAARSLAALATLALANATLHERTLANLAAARRRAARDPLTDLANHRTFQERLAGEVARATRHQRDLSLAVFDLDHFKQVNDLHGHQVGDTVLVEAARILSARAREGDVIARVGGEEFAWLMPETDDLSAWQAADRAREAIAQTRFTTVERISVSGGVCSLSEAGDGERLFALADGALYWAKHHGRDVVVRYTPEVVEVLSAEDQAIRLGRQQAVQGIRVLARAVDAKDSSTRRHSERVAELSVALAGELGWPAERRARLREAAVVHDVGKIGVPDAILLKPGRLTPNEYETVKMHAALGAEMVNDILDAEQVTWVRAHHERHDGGGYPDGLAREEVPDGARLIAVADAWDVMTTSRPYRLPSGHDEALEECRRVAGSHFHPVAVAALEALMAAGRLTLGTSA